MACFKIYFQQLPYGLSRGRLQNKNLSGAHFIELRRGFFMLNNLLVPEIDNF